jgi:ParB-like nuclease domain
MNDTASVDTDTTPTAPTVLTPAGYRRGGGRFQHTFIPVKNEPGQLVMVSKLRLHVDHRYQRTRLSQDRITRFAANWSWVSCGALIVCRRSETDFWIIDGQHRWEAAKRVRAVSELPCLCFELDDVRDEAIGFLAANTERKPPTLAEQFKALLLAGDPLAIHIKELADQAERAITAPAGSTTISCVAELMRWSYQDRAALDRVWPVIVKLCEGRALMARTVKGLVALERRMPQGQTLNGERWGRRILTIGYDDIHAGMKTMVMIENHSGERVLGEGIQRAINRGLREPLVIEWAKPVR